MMLNFKRFLIFIFLLSITLPQTVISSVSDILETSSINQADFTLAGQSSSGIELNVDIRSDINALNSNLRNFDVNGSDIPYVSKYVVVPAGMEVTAHVTRLMGRRAQMNERLGGYDFVDDASTQIETVRDIDGDPIVKVGKTAIYRGVHLVPIGVKTMQKLDDEGLVLEHNQVQIELEFEQSDQIGTGSNSDIKMSLQAHELLSAVSVNPPNRDLAEEHLGRILIMHNQNLQDDEDLAPLHEFAAWKERMGYMVEFFSANPANNRQNIENIEATIENRYYNQDPPLDYLIIIGSYDERHVQDRSPYYFPTYDEIERENDNEYEITGDLHFVTYDGDEDIMPDVVVGRFQCPTAQDLSYALHRSMSYEQAPIVGEEEWLNQVLYAMDHGEEPVPSALGVQKWSYRKLLEIGYDEVDTLMFIPRGEITGLIRERLNEGVSLALGEAWLYGMTEFEADTGHGRNNWELIANAEVGNKHPFVIANAEHYTAPVMVDFFNMGDIDNPNGNIAGIGLWKEPYDRRSSQVIGWSIWGMRYLNEFIGGNLFRTANFHLYSHIQLQMDSHAEQEELMGYLRYLGDPTLSIRTGHEGDLTVTHPEIYNTNATLVEFQVLSNDSPVNSAIVSIRQEGGFRYVSSTDAAGYVHISVPDGLADGELDICVTAHNHNTYLVTVPVEETAVNLELSELQFEDGAIRNGADTELTATFTNTGNEQVEGVTVQISSDSNYISFNREEANLGNIGAGESVGFGDEVRIQISQNCPGGTIVQLRFNCLAGEASWNNAVELTTSGPVFTIADVDVDLEPGGNNGNIRPELGNMGDLATDALTAELITNNPAVEIITGVKQYPAIDPGDEERPDDGRYILRLNDSYINGQEIDLQLHLTNESGLDLHVPFAVGPFNEPAVYDPLGPDSYGYYCFTSADLDRWLNKPEFDWNEINYNVEDDEFDIYQGRQIEFLVEEDSRLSYLNWDEVTVVELPFTFRFYGQEYDSLVISTDGWAALGTDASNLRSPTPRAPNEIGAPGALLAPCWLDWKPIEWALGSYSRNGIYQYHHEEKGLFIIEWDGLEVPAQGGGIEFDQTFQLILKDPTMHTTSSGDGEIEFQYLRFVNHPGNYQNDNGYPTIGINSPDGNDGILYTYRDPEGDHLPAQTEGVTDRFAIKFTTDIQPGLGNLTGSVVLASDPDQGIADVIVNPYRIDPIQTDQNGQFSLENIPAGEYYLAFNLDGYASEVIRVEVIEGETTELDPVQLGVPIPHVQDLIDGTKYIEVRPDSSTTVDRIVMRNDGTGTLTYNAEPRYADGSKPDFAVHSEMSINQIARPDTVNGNIRANGPIIINDEFYIPCEINDGARFISVVSLDGEFRSAFLQPQYLESEFNRSFRSITYDGEYLYGGYDDVDDTYILKMTLEGEVQDSIISPFPNYSDLPMTYSENRNSLFVTDENELVMELSINEDSFGEIMQIHSLRFPGRNSHISGMGWYAQDFEGMPLYLLDIYRADGDTVDYQRFVKMNPETGNWKIAMELPIEADGYRSSSGMGIIPPTYDSEHVRIALIRNYSSPSRANDTLAIHNVGPNMRFMIPQSHFNMSSSVRPRGVAHFGIWVQGDGWPAGAHYQWSYVVFYNVPGESLHVPVDLWFNPESNIPELEIGHPSEFALQSVYPNPFNSATRIRYSVEKASDMKINAFDLNGRLVTEIYNGFAETGYHTVNWNAHDLPSGMYVIQMERPGAVHVRKVVMMK